MKRIRRAEQSGFSLVELIVVVTIMIVVAAIAIPNVMNAVYNIRLSSSASSVASMLQVTRQEAVKNNAYYSTCWTAATPGATLWMVAGSDCGTSATGTTQVQLNSTVQVVSSGLPSTAPSVSGYTPQAATVQPAFSARGVPCAVPSGGTTCSSYVVSAGGSAPVGFAIYLKQVRPSSTDWAAVTVSPAGRIQKWRYSGSTWVQQ